MQRRGADSRVGFKDLCAMEVITEGTSSSNDIAIRHDGTIFYTDPKASKVWKLDAQTRRRSVADNFKECNGINLSADQSQLFVAHFPNRFVYSFIIDGQSNLIHKQPYFHLEVPVNLCKVSSMECVAPRTDGSYRTTGHGSSNLRPAWSFHLIIPFAARFETSLYARFGGGPDGKTLYVANVDKVVKRKTNLVGAKRGNSGETTQTVALVGQGCEQIPLARHESRRGGEAQVPPRPSKTLGVPPSSKFFSTIH